MPYYMGDYYAGDPGFGSVLRGAGRLISRGAQWLGIGARKAPLALPAAAGVAATSAIQRIGESAGGMVRRGTAAIIKHPVISAAAAAGTIGALGGAIGERGMAGGGMVVPRGYHIERRGKHPGAIIRNRRMRVTNPKALRRALRRAHGFAKLAMRTIHLVHPRKKGRFGGFKKRTRARV